ncbi:hypothetical protein VB566_15105 [Clostridium perfringens]|uniref:hypothetical protein n=1 Tax=Clostridium perfringens TaxID=1502 RepID=UPI002933FB1D|nr:hypothetical protein [Clostridium perfringens]ELP5182794.1 hypothetical protein [Clostridium perfringens]ELP5185396.1 hypothetical protein [Clostridium perfringens]ELP5188334.1 hypothetical protein [Clostridium perfringens]MEA5272125.1 hypothetical protein [Clostridium perfringens]MEA5312198.1 hypothetical protein [Clostridium perfringens]
MIVTLPLRLTESGNPGYRIAKSITITYQDGTTINNVNIIDSSIATRPFTIPMSSGYDSTGARITNIVGFDGTHLLKHCPSCGLIKATTDFGWSGRRTSGRRDQSECNDCRSSY